MLIPKTFYRGFPPDGLVSAGAAGHGGVDGFATGAFVPGYKKWRISGIRVTNATSEIALYTVFSSKSGNVTQWDVGAVNTLDPPQSTQPLAPLGNYFAYAQPCPRLDTVVLENVGWAYADEQLWVGVSPGYVQNVGFGGVAVEIYGWEVRD